MFFTPFHEQLKTARRNKGLTQQEVAKFCGITRTRLVQIETSYRCPNSQEKRSIEQLLRFPSSPIPQPEVVRRLSNFGRRTRGCAKPYFPPQDRSTHIRFRAARKRHPEFVAVTQTQLKSRSDYLDLGYLCSKIACDSYAEVLFLLALMKAGAKPALLPISDLAWTPHRVVNPSTREEINHRPQPCFVLDQAIFFFQVAFQTPRLYVVDVLLWNKGWCLLEIDAEGHDFSNDQERSLHLGMPCARSRPREIMSPGYLRNLLKHVDFLVEYRRAS